MIEFGTHFHLKGNRIWSLRTGLHHGPWLYSMVQLDGPTSMVQFLKKSIYKALVGPWLGFNPMQNDLAPKNECVNFSNICPKRIFLKEKTKSSLVILLSSMVFTCLHFLKKSSKIPFSCHGPLLFFYQCTSLPSPTIKYVGRRLRTSSTTNHGFYKALGWLHGPWCKQPFTNNEWGKLTTTINMIFSVTNPNCRVEY